MNPTAQQWFLATFLVSAVPPWYLLTPDNRELRALDEEEHVMLSSRVWVSSLSTIFSSTHLLAEVHI